MNVPRPKSLLLWLALALGICLAAWWIASQPAGAGLLAAGVRAPALASADASSAEAAEAVGPSVNADDSPGRTFWLADGTVDLEGHVFRDGAPAAAMVVTLGDVLTTEGLTPKLHATSDQAGAFHFRAPKIRGWYRLVVTAEGAAPAWALVPGDASKDGLELRLEACTMQVYGEIRDASGGAIAGALVALADVPEHHALSDAEGRYALCVPFRAAKLSVTAAGYGEWSKSFTARGDLRQDVTLMPEASLSGTTVHARGGAPLPWALVTVRASGALVREVQADGAGAFLITGIAPGSYAIEARGAAAKTHHPLEVSVFASARATVTVPLDDRVRVAGVVVGPSGPIARATINVGFHATFQWATPTRTNDAGEFVLDDAPVGSLFVKVDDYEIESPKTLQVPEGGLHGETIRVAAKATLEVAVRSDGAPVRDATVFLRGTSSSDEKTSNSAGTVTFRGLDEGDCRVYAEQGEKFVVLEHVQVARNRATAITLELAAARQIEGDVHDERGAPVDGARVWFIPASSAEDTGASAITGRDGSFRGGPLRGPARYRAKVSRSGIDLEPKTPFSEIDVPANGLATPAHLTFVVRAEDRALSGVVVDAHGGPVRDARVIVRKPERHAATIATTYTGNDGTFVLRRLGEGPFAIEASDAGGSVALLSPITLPHDAVRLVLPEVGTIAGKLVGFSETPSIMAWSIAGYDWDFHPSTPDSGRFEIHGLSRGRYHVAATTKSASAQVTVDVDGSGVTSVELVASDRRTVRGRALDLVHGTPLVALHCQLAPDLGDTRSPVVVPGSAFTDEAGAFVFEDVPRAPLYMWCLGDASFRGGVARIPEGGSAPVTVWGLDVRGRPSLDTGALGLTLADDHPFSRRVVAVEARGPAARAGLAPGDVIERIGEQSVTECGNGIVRYYLALVLTSSKVVSLVVTRSGAPVELLFRM